MANRSIKEEIERALGAPLEAFNKIRLAPGVLGKTGSVALALMVVFAVAVFKLTETWAILLIVFVAIASFFAYQNFSFRFAEKNPGLALTEGAELVQYKLMEQQAAKGVIIDTDSSEVVTPPTPNPQIEPPAEAKDAS